METAIVLAACVVLLFGVMDVGLAISRVESLSNAAKAVSRAAMVHGQNAGPEQEVWGPTTYEAQAADSHDIASVARPLLITMPPADVAMRVEWLDADVQTGDRVRTSLSFEHQGVLTWFFPTPLTLTAQSTAEVE